MRYFVIRVVTILAGLGMTIYGVLANDAMWVAFGFPMFLLGIYYTRKGVAE